MLAVTLILKFSVNSGTPPIQTLLGPTPSVLISVVAMNYFRSGMLWCFCDTLRVLLMQLVLANLCQL